MMLSSSEPTSSEKIQLLPSTERLSRIIREMKEENLRVYNALSMGVELPPDSDHVLKKLEKDGSIKITPAGIEILEKFHRYYDVWSRFCKLRGLFGIDLKLLLENSTVGMLASSLGYRQGRNFRKVLVALEKEGILPVPE